MEYGYNEGDKTQESVVLRSMTGINIVFIDLLNT